MIVSKFILSYLLNYLLVVFLVSNIVQFKEYEAAVLNLLGNSTRHNYFQNHYKSARKLGQITRKKLVEKNNVELVKNSAMLNTEFSKPNFIAGKLLNQTLNKISMSSENGRLILLVCKIKCLQQRIEIPKWNDEFKLEFNISANFNSIDYYFHYYQLPFKHFNIDEKMSFKQIGLFFIVAEQFFFYDGNLDRTSFRNWLLSFEKITSIQITNQFEFNLWINKGSIICPNKSKYATPYTDKEKLSNEHNGGSRYEYILDSSNNATANSKTNSSTFNNFAENNTLKFEKHLLIIHHLTLCPNLLIKNIAQMFKGIKNVTVANLQRPLSLESDVILRQRFPVLQHQCKMLILTNNNAFVQLPNKISLKELYNFTREWNNEQSCPSTNKDYVNRIRNPLNEIQIEFYKDEFQIQHIEYNRVFIIVGIVGGLAVVALAISIFWGLNGSSFVVK